MTDIVFNELSCRTQVTQQAAARSLMEQFSSLLGKARQGGFKGDLRIPETFFNTELAAGYTVSNWIFDKQSPQEHRTYLKSQGTKSPYLADLPQLQQIFGISEFRFNGDVAEGLGAAFLMDALALSLDSNSVWHSSLLTLNLLQLNKEGELEPSVVEVSHASRSTDLGPHVERLTAANFASIRSGEDIWLRKQELFPGLLFVTEVEKQIGELGYHIPHVIRKLSELQQKVSSWSSGGFEITGLSGNPRTESTTTLEKYGEQRTFRCHDGVQRVFSWHMSLPGGWRIHFFPLEAERRIIIGYVGKHLDTVKFN